MSEQLLAVRDGGILRLTMNRPDKLNAMTSEMAGAARTAFEDTARDARTRVVLLTGAGRGFCAGQDLGEEGVAPGSDLGAVIERHYNPLIHAIRSLEKPVIARVNGIAAGAGANIAFACDIVVAAASAQFVESFARIGLLPDSGGTWMLPRLVGHARAVALAMLGTPFGARQAYEWGAIWKVVEDEELDAQCDALARALASGPTKGYGAIKSAIAAAWNTDIDAQLELERDAQRALGTTDDFREGVEAFAKKRPPSFRGS
ncbi:MAG TPA: 2-(1,2-epoxy-1,2-dihydrophenyl)acetyl-CoA isomerase PaaG [Candidatus Tyrphobacter sp.]